MGRVKTDARREGFLDAAQAIFQELSFEKASMSAIAERVGSSKATLYRYFESKEALFLELVRRSAGVHGEPLMPLLQRSGGVVVGEELPVAAMQALAALDPSRDIAESLKEFGQRILTNFHTPQRMAVRRMVIAAAVDPAVGRLFYEQGPLKGLQYLERYFAATIAAGRLRDADPRVVACHFQGLLTAEVNEVGLLNVRTTLSEQEVRTIVDRAVDAFVRAYGI
jgi:AcrR family transcriptional regulator